MPFTRDTFDRSPGDKAAGAAVPTSGPVPLPGFARLVYDPIRLAPGESDVQEALAATHRLAQGDNAPDVAKSVPWDLSTRGARPALDGQAPTDASGKPIYDGKGGSTSGSVTPLGSGRLASRDSGGRHPSSGQFVSDGGIAHGHPDLDSQPADRSARTTMHATTDLPGHARVDSAIETSLGRHLGSLGVEQMDLRGPAGGAPLFNEVGPSPDRPAGMHHLGQTPTTPDPGAALANANNGPAIPASVRQWDDPPRDISPIGPAQATQGAGQNR